MRSIAKMELVGNVGADPDARTAPSGTRVARFSLAVNRRQGGAETTDWWRCVAFGKTAELVETLVTKGAAIVVFGEPQQDSYEKNGQTVHVVDVVVRDFSVLAAPKDGPVEAMAKQARAQQAPAATDDNDDLPF
jgi:single-strand DNA-binding protein